MFGKEGDAVTGGEGNLNSILGPGCKVKGNIEIKGTLRVDGDFDGEINCPETLIIGKSGVVKADVKVKNAVIGGKLVGPPGY
jgi:cytoskeletal protein CcmA (bactofilin family)